MRNFVRGRRLTLEQREAIAVLQLPSGHLLFALSCSRWIDKSSGSRGVDLSIHAERVE
ncbi:hypothetical protein HYR99_17595 [Candidatus Poribacteria bacterium]|nr:hypothetical protein [Candidatus Poribacteria bacterium]